jgi:uncharacterized protein with PIN domain
MLLLVTDESQRLARWLRLMGHDAALMAARPLAALYQRAYREGRVVVTRNRWVRPGGLCRVVTLQSERLEDQLRQLLGELPLTIDARRLFTRCDRCNVPADPIEKSQAQSRVPPYVFQTQEAFHACPSCGRIYWAATHYQRAQGFFASLQSREPPPTCLGSP